MSDISELLRQFNDAITEMAAAPENQFHADPMFRIAKLAEVSGFETTGGFMERAKDKPLVTLLEFLKYGVEEVIETVTPNPVLGWGPNLFPPGLTTTLAESWDISPYAVQGRIYRLVYVDAIPGTSVAFTFDPLGTTVVLTKNSPFVFQCPVIPGTDPPFWPVFTFSVPGGLDTPINMSLEEQTVSV